MERRSVRVVLLVLAGVFLLAAGASWVMDYLPGFFAALAVSSVTTMASVLVGTRR